MKTIVTGSFDPFTLGHLDVTLRAKACFSDVTVVMLKNPDREYLFTEEERLVILEKSLDGENVPFAKYDGETAEYCKQNGVSLIIRGIKSASEYAYERDMADYNKAHCGAETLLLPMRVEVSATAVREALKNKLPIDKYVTRGVKEWLAKFTK